MRSRPDVFRISLLEANPFAKKAKMSPPKAGIGIGSKKTAVVGPQKSLYKSENFLGKVEAAEMSTDPPKREPNPFIVSLTLP